MDNLQLTPVGLVECAEADTGRVSVFGSEAMIRVFPEYQAALHRVEENSHLWVLCWFHRADRTVLQRTPGRFDPSRSTFGVFGLRTPTRPNPIALTLVALHRVEGNLLHVSGLDAVDGTPVLDIKPYFESDTVFSPRTPYLRPLDEEGRLALFRKQALLHHGEECLELFLGVKMALLADQLFGQIQSPDLCVAVDGSPCLADVLQGLTRARLANPPRFAYRPAAESMVTWRKGEQRLSMRLRDGLRLEEALSLRAEELICVKPT